MAESLTGPSLSGNSSFRSGSGQPQGLVFGTLKQDNTQMDPVTLNIPPLVNFQTAFSIATANFFFPAWGSGETAQSWRRIMNFPTAFRQPLTTAGFANATSNGTLAGTINVTSPFYSNGQRVYVAVVDDDSEPVFGWVAPNVTGLTLYQNAFAGATDPVLPLADIDGDVNNDITLARNAAVYRVNRPGLWGQNPQPFHTFECMNRENEVRARVRVMIQEWNVVDDFNVFVNPEIPASSAQQKDPNIGDEGGDESDFPGNPANDFFDWKNITDAFDGWTTYPQRSFSDSE